MTRTFLKKKLGEKKTFMVRNRSLNRLCNAKGDSATNSIHPETNYLPQKGKTKGIRDCS